MITITCVRAGKVIKDRHGNLIGHNWNKKLKGQFKMSFEDVEALAFFCRNIAWGTIFFVDLKNELSPEDYRKFNKKVRAMSRYYYDCPRSQRKESRIKCLRELGLEESNHE